MQVDKCFDGAVLVKPRVYEPLHGDIRERNSSISSGNTTALDPICRRYVCHLVTCILWSGQAGRIPLTPQWATPTD